MTRHIALVLLMGLSVALSPLPASGFVLTADNLISESTKGNAWQTRNFTDPAPELGMGWVIYKYVDLLPLLEAEMIRDEAWLDLIAYERDPQAVLPLLSAAMFMSSLARSTRIDRASQDTRTRVYAGGGGPGIPVVLRLLYPGLTGQKPIGFLSEEERVRKSPYMGILGFLFEQEGIFSGEEWNWENFLPRVLSVTVLVVVGLLFIEFLRFIVVAGMRAIGRQDRRL